MLLLFLDHIFSMSLMRNLLSEDMGSWWFKRTGGTDEKRVTTGKDTGSASRAQSLRSPKKELSTNNSVAGR